MISKPKISPAHRKPPNIWEAQAALADVLGIRATPFHRERLARTRSEDRSRIRFLATPVIESANRVATWRHPDLSRPARPYEKTVEVRLERADYMIASGAAKRRRQTLEEYVRDAVLREIRREWGEK